jgi:hypothetical protein
MRRKPRQHLPHPTVVDVDPEDPANTLVADTEGNEDTTEPEHVKDTGDLYGVHVVPAADREVPDTEDEGEHVFDAIEQHAAEYGPVPEHELDVIDDSDDHDNHPPTDHRDRPKADRGSGGPGGL